VQALLIICVFAFTSHVALAASSDLGLLTNYYHDCPASLRPHAAYVRKVLKRALAGDHAAMRAVVIHHSLFSTGDNEGYSEVPQALLRTVGDDRYAVFVLHQPRDIQELALFVCPEQIPAFNRRFPKTSKLYHERFLRSHQTSNQLMHF
jgi:hypothetical protein